MGLRGISLGSILIIIFVVLLVFGTKRLRHLGEDLGHALRGFRKGIQEPETPARVEESQPSDHTTPSA